MRIEKIKLHNYRQYRDVEIPFYNEKLNICIGKMGIGKTNILNAINWCLYGEEPYLSMESKGLPILNLATIENSENVESRSIKIEIWVTTDDNQKIIFERKVRFLIYDGKIKNPVAAESPHFEVKISNKEGNFEIFKDEDAKPYIERFVPRGTKEFFFFDGERLDKYFREATAEKIKHSIFQICQMNLLEKVKENLENVIKDYKREAGKNNPEIDAKNKKLEDIRKSLKDCKSQISKVNEQIVIAKNKKEEYNEKLRGLPDTVKLQKRKNILQERKKEKEIYLDTKKDNKHDILFEIGKNLMLFESIKNSISIIEEKERKKEIPPTIDRNLLKHLLENNKCICGRQIEVGSQEEEKLNELLKGIKLSSFISRELLHMKNPLISIHDEIKQFKIKTKEITEEISRYQKELDDINTEISQIDNELGGFDIEKIRMWHQAYQDFEKIYSENHAKLIIFNGEKEGYLNDIENLENEIDNDIKKKKILEQIRCYHDFSKKAYNVLKNTKDTIMDEIRKEVAIETKRIFFDLMWKEKTFEDVTINEDYNISVTHVMGYECLGSISGGEREILALSFTLALHKISGFDSPIIIDRPLTMVSGESREYVAKIFLELALERQIMLLLTPDEFKDVRKFWSNDFCNFKEIRLVGEREVKLEAL